MQINSAEESKMDDLETWLHANRLGKLLTALNEEDVNELEDLEDLETEQDIDDYIKELNIEKIMLRKRFKKAVIKLNNINKPIPNNNKSPSNNTSQNNRKHRSRSPPPPSRRKNSVDIDDDQKTEDINDIRSKWIIGSLCEIYSHSMSKWINGEIINIFTDDEGEWLTVRYMGKEKDVSRYSDDIRPTDHIKPKQYHKQQNNQSHNNNQNQMEYMQKMMAFQAEKMKMEFDKLKQQQEMEKQRMILEAEREKEKLKHERERVKEQMNFEREKDRLRLESERDKERMKYERQIENQKLQSKIRRESEIMKQETDIKLQDIKSKADRMKRDKERLQQMYEEKNDNFDKLRQDSEMALSKVQFEKDETTRKLQKEKLDLLDAAGVSVTWEKETKNGEYEALSESLSKIIEELGVNETYDPSQNNSDNNSYDNSYGNSYNGGFDQKSQATQGSIYFQTGFYNAKQMQTIDSIFGMNINQGPKMLFGDDYNDRMRSNATKRQRFGGQSKIMGHWDRKYGFGIPTSFQNARSMNFIYNDHNFKLLMANLFNQLRNHLLAGGDIVIPYPSKQDLSQRRQKYFPSGVTGYLSGQKIFHNLGTGIASVSFEHLLIIQKHVEELKKVASKHRIVSQYNASYNAANTNSSYQQNRSLISTEPGANYPVLGTNNNPSAHSNEVFIITKTSTETAVMREQNKFYNIQRKIMKGDPVWQWKEDDSSWKLYNDEINSAVEKLANNHSYTYTFSGNNKKYQITRVDKNTAFQINLSSNFRREVRRIIDENSDKNKIKYPQYWDMSKIIDYYEPVLTATPKNERDRIAKAFLSTTKQRYAQAKVVKVETLQNKRAYDKYWNERDTLLKSKKGDKNKVNEKELWHGTNSQGVMVIVQKEGFRKEFNKTSAHGKGTYFARDANYSVGYSHHDNKNVYKMFLCSVLCGEFCKGGSQYELKSWPKKPSDGLLYDSLVDNTANPSIYVIHDDVRALPKFVIHFTLQ